MTARFDLPLSPEAPGVARHAMEQLLYAWGYRDEDWLAAAMIITSEIVANAVIHGGGCLSLEIQSHDNNVTVAAADGSSVVPRRRSMEPGLLAAGGRGIAIIEALGCQWGVHDHEGGKRVWVRLPPYHGPAVEPEHG